MTAPDPTLNFHRVARVVTGTNGAGIDIEDLRISFKVTKTIGRTPNTATIKIWNLSPHNEALIKGEFDEVLLEAGYRGATRGLFRGNIRYAEGYPDQAERVLQLDCGDGDRDFQNATINISLAGGSTTGQLIDKLTQGFSTVKKGTVVIKDRQRLRGRVISGMARDVLDRIAADHDSHWWVQDGVLNIVHVASTLPNQAIVVSAGTGLLGTPKRTDKGIEVTCQLNPLIVPGGTLKLDNNSFLDKVRIQRLKLPGAAPHTGAKAKRAHKLAAIDPDGIYKVLRVEHEGDMRSQDWKSKSICRALGGVAAKGGTA